mgnify:CR=1 FL=1
MKRFLLLTGLLITGCARLPKDISVVQGLAINKLLFVNQDEK